jgi:hypothetical protein
MQSLLMPVYSAGATLSHAYSAGATNDISSRDFKLYRLVILGDMVLQCIGGERDMLR